MSVANKSVRQYPVLVAHSERLGALPVLPLLDTELASVLMPLAIAGIPGKKSKLVGRPLLYAISCFASIGVFLVRFPHNCACFSPAKLACA